MKNIVFSGILMFVLSSLAAGQGKSKMSRVEYILTYKDAAIEEMLRSGVPASITLAQGMLESDNGNSTLAVKGNNHFGIKCHNGWKGKKIHHDDDAKNECFRQYKSARESYADHSDFLMGSSRYAFLFNIEKTDYKEWARGLKKAGYATNNKYADLLIKIIEENELHQFDLIAVDEYKPLREKKGKTSPLIAGREVHVRNRIKYIIVKEGDSFEKLKTELHLLNFELFSYNDMPRNENLREGQILYIQPKRNKAEKVNDYHTVLEAESMWHISQIYGIKLDKLYKMNLMYPGTEPEIGDRLYLRQMKKGSIKENLELQEKIEEMEKEEGDKIRFEFEEGI